MKLLSLMTLIFFSLNAFADLELKDFVSADKFEFKKSSGPSYKQKLADHAIESWFEDHATEFSYFDDNLNHEAADEESCRPKKVKNAYRTSDTEVDDVEVEFYPGSDNVGVVFKSIKKKGSSKSIGYVVYPTATYKVTYTYYETHRDYHRDRRGDGFSKSVTVDCTVVDNIGFYYEHKSDKEVHFIGHSEDLYDLRSKLVVDEHAVLLGGKNLKNEKAALNYLNKVKSASAKKQPTGACYTGDWEKAVDSTSFKVGVYVMKVQKDGTLKVEVEDKRDLNTKNRTGEYIFYYDTIERCN